MPVYHVLAQLTTAADTASMTRGMMLGAGVLIATQAVLVVVAVIWYVRGQRAAGPTDRGSEPDVS